MLSFPSSGSQKARAMIKQALTVVFLLAISFPSFGSDQPASKEDVGKKICFGKDYGSGIWTTITRPDRVDGALHFGGELLEVNSDGYPVIRVDWIEWRFSDKTISRVPVVEYWKIYVGGGQGEYASIGASYWFQLILDRDIRLC